MNLGIAAQHRIFFKVDIEGSEYRILDDLIATAPSTEGLAIEFHDVDLHMDRIRSFIQNYPLELCHVHINNYSPLNQGTPLAIECSFTRHAVAGEFASVFPSTLDMSNNPKKSDYQIEFF